MSSEPFCRAASASSCLFRPLQIANDLWKAGEPTGQSTQAGAGTSPLLRPWWAGWLSSGLLLNALLQFRIDGSLEMAFEWTSAEQALRAIGRLGSTGQG